jgi:hypothetical protein
MLKAIAKLLGKGGDAFAELVDIVRDREYERLLPFVLLLLLRGIVSGKIVLNHVQFIGRTTEVLKVFFYALIVWRTEGHVPELAEQTLEAYAEGKPAPQAYKEQLQAELPSLEFMIAFDDAKS